MVPKTQLSENTKGKIKLYLTTLLLVFLALPEYQGMEGETLIL